MVCGDNGGYVVKTCVVFGVGVFTRALKKLITPVAPCLFLVEVLFAW